MSENQQEETADRTGIPAAPGHQAGPPPTSEPDTGPEDEALEADDVAAGHPNKKEPHAGLDK